VSLGQRLGESTVPASRLRAVRPDRVWALDFQFDQTADGRIVKLLHVVDEFTREALEMECERRIDADSTVVTLERLVELRGCAPEFIRCDNGPELTANALRDWCRFSGAGTAYIEPGSRTVPSAGLEALWKHQPEADRRKPSSFAAPIACMKRNRRLATQTAAARSLMACKRSSVEPDKLHWK
jgi:hypothetical protein